MSAWLIAAAALLALLPLFVLLTALIERSGPIRLRHWVEESGGRLRSLFESPARFGIFRFLLNLIAKLLPLGLFAAFAELAARNGLPRPFLISGALVAIAVAVSEVASRSQLRRDPEEALRRLTGLYRLVLALLLPLIWAIAPLVPDPSPESEDESAPGDDEASEQEVEAFIDVGTREGILEPEDRDLVWGVVDFGDTQVKSVMTPRVDIVAARADEPLDAVIARVIEASVSRLPIYADSVDQIVGIVHIRDLLAASAQEPRPATVASLVKPAVLVPETKLLGDLLKMLQARRQQMAIVINEFGGTEGLVTVEDLIEEIVGEIEDEHDDAQPENVLLDDGSVILDGRAAIEILDERFGWRPEEEGSETVGGLVSGHLGYVPTQGEAVELRGLRFEVERADERRILSLRVRRVAADSDVGSEASDA